MKRRLVLLGLALCACKPAGADDAKKAERGKASEALQLDDGVEDLTSIDGTWVNECDGADSDSLATRTKFVFAKGAVTFASEVFDDKACKHRIAHVAGKGAYELAAVAGVRTVKELDRTWDDFTLTVDAASGAEIFKTFCGGGFQIGQARPLTRAQCGADVADAAGATNYDLASVARGVLVLGKNDDAHNGTSAAKRPVLLDFEGALKRR